jgi:hypothetical protein
MIIMNYGYRFNPRMMAGKIDMELGNVSAAHEEGVVVIS